MPIYVAFSKQLTKVTTLLKTKPMKPIFNLNKVRIKQTTFLWNFLKLFSKKFELLLQNGKRVFAVNFFVHSRYFQFWSQLQCSRLVSLNVRGKNQLLVGMFKRLLENKVLIFTFSERLLTYHLGSGLCLMTRIEGAMESGES